MRTRRPTTTGSRATGSKVVELPVGVQLPVVGVLTTYILDQEEEEIIIIIIILVVRNLMVVT